MEKLNCKVSYFIVKYLCKKENKFDNEIDRLYSIEFDTFEKAQEHINKYNDLVLFDNINDKEQYFKYVLSVELVDINSNCAIDNMEMYFYQKVNGNVSV